MADRSAADPAYFDRLYRYTDDPWSLDTRFYEQRKRMIVMSSLPAPRFVRAYEPGCATGALTVQLAERCDGVVACDVAARAVELTSQRTRGLGNVHVVQQAFPDQAPVGTFDLIVLSEVGYYAADLTELTRAVDAALTDDGVVLACHWRHPARDHPHTAEQVHAALGADRHRVVHHIEADFMLDVWTRDGRSVAQREGIVGLG